MRPVQPLLALLACAAACTDRPADDSAPDSEAEALSWSVVVSDAPEGAFMAVWGASGDDLWIVGGQPGEGVALRGSGDDWTPLALPPGTPLVNWVHGVAPDDVWLAGVGGTLLRWDGQGFTDHSIDMPEALWGVHARAADDVVAVGGESGFGGERAVAFHFDGQAWTELALPPELTGLRNLFKVQHDGVDWWLVGQGGAALRGPSATTLAAVSTGTTSDLVTANRPASGGPLLVVGGRGSGRVLEVDGEGLAVTAEAYAGLNGVAVLPDGRAIVAGEFGYTALYDSADDSLAHVRPLTTDVLHGAWAEPGGQMYAVGGNLFTSGDLFHGVILRGPTP